MLNPFNPSSPNSDENVISPDIITTCSNNQAMRIWGGHQEKHVLIFGQIVLTSSIENV